MFPLSYVIFSTPRDNGDDRNGDLVSPSEMLPRATGGGKPGQERGSAKWCVRTTLQYVLSGRAVRSRKLVNSSARPHHCLQRRVPPKAKKKF